MDEISLSATAQIIAAIGTVSVAILAIWGDRVRALLVGPKIKIALRSPRGNLTFTQDDKNVVYYHISVTNQRTWSPARNLVIKLTKIESKAADGTYQPVSLVHQLQFTWAHPQFHEISPTVTSSDMCDFGLLAEGAGHFQPSFYVMPNDFGGYVQKGQSTRFTITATADNYHSKTPLIIEVAWDGVWTDDTEALMRHLVVQEV